MLPRTFAGLLGLIVYVLSISQPCSTTVINDFIYQEFNDANSKIFLCPRRFNATHRFGCASSHGSGVPYFVGSVHPPNSRVISFSTFVSDLLGNAKFTLIIEAYDSETIRSLRTAERNILDRINSVIIMKAPLSPYSLINESLSHDKSCPNTDFGLSVMGMLKECKLIDDQSAYAGFAHIDWPFPIIYARYNDNRELFRKIIFCMRNSTINGLECRVKLNVENVAATNSRQCSLRNAQNAFEGTSKEFCYPIIAQNIMAPLVPIEDEYVIPAHSITILAARIDSFSTFTLSPGELSVYPGVTILLTVADLLRPHAAEFRKAGVNVLFALFDGESFGFVGSSSWIYNNNVELLFNDTYLGKITLDKIKAVIELNNLVPTIIRNETGKVELLLPSFSAFSSKISGNLIRSLNDEMKKKNKISSVSQKGMPPCTAEVFHRFASHIETLLLTSTPMNGSSPNLLYHSMLSEKETYSRFIGNPFLVVKFFIEDLSEVVARVTFKSLLKSRSYVDSYVYTSSDHISTLEHRIQCLFDYKKVNCDGLGSTNFSNAGSQPIKLLNYLMFNATKTKIRCDNMPDYKDMTIELADRNLVKFIARECEGGKVFASQTVVVKVESPYFANLNNKEWLHKYGHLPFSTVAVSRMILGKPLLAIFMVSGPVYVWSLLVTAFIITFGSFWITWKVAGNTNKFFESKKKRVNGREQEEKKDDKDMDINNYFSDDDSEDDLD